MYRDGFCISWPCALGYNCWTWDQRCTVRCFYLFSLLFICLFISLFWNSPLELRLLLSTEVKSTWQHLQSHLLPLLLFVFGETRDGGKEQRSKGYRRKEAEEGEKKERRKGTDRGGGREKEEVELREREKGCLVSNGFSIPDAGFRASCLLDTPFYYF